jgi:2,4-dienoyl-CoA reductase-like NADH-dependent reductase (Old Yellow Enzyme family)
LGKKTINQQDHNAIFSLTLCTMKVKLGSNVQRILLVKPVAEGESVRKLFEDSVINGMNLPNRFVRSATWEGMATDEGAVTPKLIETMAALARGGVGLIIGSHAYVWPDGKASPWQLGIYNDELVPGLQEMTAAVHACGGRIIAQLAHAGCFTSAQLTGQPPLVVSDFDELSG